MAALPALAFVYLDGPEVYVHPAEVRPFTAQDLRYVPRCTTECEIDFALGDMLCITDPGVQGESYAHLACLLATGGMLMTEWEAIRHQEDAQRLPGPVHAGR